MFNVYVVQESSGKNLAPARDYGSLVYLLSGKFNHQVVGNTEDLVAHLKQRLRNFGDKDYILAIGDPSAIGAAVAIAANNNGGRVNVLKWDRFKNEYYPVSFQL
jgi:hypothetical protein